MLDKKKKVKYIGKNGKEITIEELNKWMGDNYLWLTEWLTNVVVVDNLAKDQSVATFQTFQAAITHPLPFGIIDTGNLIKGWMINQATIGLMSLNPPQFPGFFQKTGRLPEKGDTVVFTALKWFKLEYVTGSNLILAEGSSVPKIPVLTTVCAIDYLVK